MAPDAPLSARPDGGNAVALANLAETWASARRLEEAEAAPTTPASMSSPRPRIPIGGFPLRAFAPQEAIACPVLDALLAEGA
jgi:hypothetical protein